MGHTADIRGGAAKIVQGQLTRLKILLEKIPGPGFGENGRGAWSCKKVGSVGCNWQNLEAQRGMAQGTGLQKIGKGSNAMEIVLGKGESLFALDCVGNREIMRDRGKKPITTRKIRRGGSLGNHVQQNISKPLKYGRAKVHRHNRTICRLTLGHGIGDRWRKSILQEKTLAFTTPQKKKKKRLHAWWHLGGKSRAGKKHSTATSRYPSRNPSSKIA